MKSISQEKESGAVSVLIRDFGDDFETFVDSIPPSATVYHQTWLRPVLMHWDDTDSKQHTRETHVPTLTLTYFSSKTSEGVHMIHVTNIRAGENLLFLGTDESKEKLKKAHEYAEKLIHEVAEKHKTAPGRLRVPTATE